MPEIAEIARIVHYLRLHLVGKTIKKATAIEDANVFGKVGTSGPEVAAALTGKKVLSAGSQGKYFWLVLDKPPHPVMHFGMTGWIHIKSDQTAYTNYYKSMKPGEAELWPPKYWKFRLETDDDPAVEIAYTDPRRFGRVRLVDCPGKDIRRYSPLVENGPDPVVDTDIFTEEFLKQKMKSRRVPIKALLLDQAVLSGVGNWVADEVLYQAKLHPEQYCNEFNDEQMKKLYESIRYVCQLACDKLGDSDQFPEGWMFHVRWGKGKKGAASHLPNGERLAFLTVGGRTSCYAPGVQKKTGHVVDGVKEEPIESDGDVPKKKPAAKSKVKKEEADDSAAERTKRKAATKTRPKQAKAEETEEKPATRKRKAETASVEVELPVDGKTSKKPNIQQKKPQPAIDGGGSRRSSRLSGKTA